MKAELKAAVQATGSHLMDIHGIGPAGAARILADVGDITRFPDRNHFASWTGTAPIDASSGQHLRHRLSRAGQPPPQPRALHRRDRPAAQRHPRPRLLPPQARRRARSSMEAMRCLRRRLSDAVYRQLVADARGQEHASPGGHPGASLSSSAAGLSPDTGTSDQPLPGPAQPDATATPARATPHGPRSCHTQAARPRCQRGAPHRTNDVDTDQRRRTLDSAGAMPLTNPFIEGSHERTFSASGGHAYSCSCPPATVPKPEIRRRPTRLQLVARNA